jgi:hypothetical protein
MRCCNHIYNGSLGKEEDDNMMTLEALIIISGMSASAGAFYVAWRAHKNAFKPTGPDEELVKRFVESAPLDRLKNITTEPA